MQTGKTPIRFALAVLAATPLAAAAQDPALDSAKAKLDALTTPRTQSSEQAQEDLDAVVSSLLNADAGGLVLLGESIGPALRQRVEQSSFATLTSNHTSNPLRWLVPAAPKAALGYYDDLERTNPGLFDALTRSKYPFTHLADESLLADKDAGFQERVLDLTVRALAHETLEPSERDEIVKIALTNGLVDDRLIQYIESRLADSKVARDAVIALFNLEDLFIEEELQLRLLGLLAGSTASDGSDAVGIKGGLAQRWLKNDVSPALVRSTIEALVRSKNERFKKGWSSRYRHLVDDMAQALALLDGALNAEGELEEDLTKSALAVTAKWGASSPQRASAALDFLTRPDASPLMLELLSHKKSGDYERTSDDRPHLARLLAALPPSRIPEALAWLSTTDLPVAGYAYENVSQWAHGAQELRSILRNGSRTPQERTLCAAGLIGSGAATSEDVEYAISLLTTLAASPATEEVVIDSSNMFRAREPRARLLWGRVTLAMMGNETVPDPVAAELSLLVDASTPESKEIAAGVLRAAASRQQAASETIHFKNLRHFGLEAMAQAPELAQPSLLLPWIKESTSFHTVASAVEAAGDAGLSSALLDHFVSVIRLSDNGYSRRSVADAMLQMSGPEPVQALIEVTLESSDTNFTDHVEARISNRLTLKRAATEWSRLASGGDSRPEAVAKVLALLDSDNQEVRVEAIHGLGTLGAVETIPRLIEFVASDEPAIKAAALATLKRLREAAPK